MEQLMYSLVIFLLSCIASNAIVQGRAEASLRAGGAPGRGFGYKLSAAARRTLSQTREVRDVVALVERRTDVSSSEDYVNFALDQSNRKYQMSISSRSIKISSKTMACVSLRSSLRILWTAVAALVFLTRSSAAPTFGGADKAM
ncbi:hypothetical protein SFRURICE_004497, partial [Spodoptera frugiperda]